MKIEDTLDIPHGFLRGSDQEGSVKGHDDSDGGKQG
jgi:hypothetical protein